MNDSVSPAPHHSAAANDNGAASDAQNALADLALLLARKAAHQFYFSQAVTPTAANENAKF